MDTFERTQEIAHIGPQPFGGVAVNFAETVTIVIARPFMLPMTHAVALTRDDDGDGFCEVHCNTTEGLWTDVRNFLRPFKGVHKKNLAGYIALCEFRRNIKRISPAFIAELVASHSFYP